MQEPPRHLEDNIVSVWGLVSQSLAGMAPACDVVAFMTAGAAFALVALPLSYLWALALMFIEVNHLPPVQGSGLGGRILQLRLPRAGRRCSRDSW